MSDTVTHTVTITGYNSDGEGVARLDDGRVVFVRAAARGDVLECKLMKEYPRSARAEIVRIIKQSPHRIGSDCAVFPECGGCDYRHITYEEELYAKLQCVNDALRRIGGLSVKVDEISQTGQINGYRNKAVLHSNGSAFGFYRAGSHDVVPINQCLLLQDDLNCAIGDLSQKDIGLSNEITLRAGRNGISQPLEIELDGLIFAIDGFFQVNTTAALILFEKAREYAALSGEDIFIDLYCGVGALTLFVGRDAGYALGVEHNSDAVKIAQENARRNGLLHIDFLNADAAGWSIDPTRCNADFICRNVDATKPDCVIVDPPRKGLSPDTVRKILELSPKRLVYISCNPATLARDLKAMNDYSYSIRKICAVDMFPRTANIECCCLLVRKI